MNRLKMLEETISKWPNVSIHSHRLGGTEFCVGSAEIGHIHRGGVVDIPSHVQFGTRSWRTVWQKSTGGFQIQVGRLSTSVAMKTSSLPFGSCGYRTCGIH
jgi:Family of unknown function (DUF5519)